MKWCFAILMRLYPSAYREEFGTEMAAVFEESEREQRAEGWGAYLLFLLAELVGLVGGAVRERVGTARGLPVQAPIGILLGACGLAGIIRLMTSRFGGVTRELLASHDEVLAVVAMAAVSVVLIAGLSAAFVLNLRVLVRRLER